MKRLLISFVLTLSLFLPAQRAHAQYGVTGYWTGSWTQCYYLFFCFPMYWSYTTYADGTFNYNDSTGFSYTGWY